ncbi:MAG: hypothetical protein A2095_12060 [Sphingomonadales bacterium GWF1_63_6]|nr:MAG: hypothetical protein A2095_12060 [Sphingomonadales bacterium GWF1_63_6]
MDFDEEAAKALKIQFADFVMEWNDLEKGTALLLYYLLGGDSRVDALTARMQASAYSEAINALSYLHPQNVQDHLQAYTKRFDRIRAWRNHYVHGLFIVAYTNAGAPTAIVDSISVKKGKLGHTHNSVTGEDLRLARSWITDLRQYQSVLFRAIVGHPADVANPLGPLDQYLAPSMAPDLPSQGEYPFFPRKVE